MNVYTAVWLLLLGVPALMYRRKVSEYRRKYDEYKNDKDSRWRSAPWEPDHFYMVPFGFGVGVLLIASVVFAAEAQHNNISADSDAYVIAQRIEQRDELVPLIEDELSADDLAELMAALPDDIPNLRVWLGKDASTVLVERAARILAINEDVMARELEVTEKRKYVCDVVSNPFTPRFPFGVGLPDCELGKDDVR